MSNKVGIRMCASELVNESSGQCNRGKARYQCQCPKQKKIVEEFLEMQRRPKHPVISWPNT